MSEPTFQQPPPPPPPAPAAAPFSGTPRPVLGGSGCGKPLWIGCGVAFLLLAIAGIFLVTRAKDLLAWSFDLVGPAVLQNAAPEVTEEDKQRFGAAIAAAKRQLQEGKIDPVALQAVQGSLQKASRAGTNKLSRTDFLTLVESLEKLGGVSNVVPGAPAPEPSAAPVEPATPSPPGAPPAPSTA
jgi:hypothetical protein